MDRFEYNLFMYEYTGGVSAMTSQQFQAVNGFSNLYLGWGCEALANRLVIWNNGIARCSCVA